MTQAELASLINEAAAHCYGCLGASLPDQLRLALLDRIVQSLENTKQVLDSGVEPFGGLNTVTIASAHASAANPILVTYVTDGVVFTTVWVANIVPGTQFDVQAGAANNGNVSWAIMST